MIKKSYSISGFDCANCAAKAEAHLNKNDKIELARLDFAGNRLYITFKNEELSIKEIKKIIKEVESDKIDIKDTGEKIEKPKIFDKSAFILIARIAIVAIIVCICELVPFFKDRYTFNTPAYWVNFALYIVAILVITYDIFAKVINKIIHLQNPIDEYLLISIAAIGAFTLACIYARDHHMDWMAYMEGVMVVTLFQIGRIVEGIATNKSKYAISTAVNLRVEFAHLLDGEELVQVKPEQLKIDNVIVVKTGETIPVDGVVIDGNGYIDTSSLTGEYVPVRADADLEVFAGCLLKEGTIKVKVTKEYKDSAVSKILELISSSGERKAKADKFITKFARWYTPAVCLISALYILIYGLITKDWQKAVYQGLEALVVSCPCAIVISVPLCYFAAIGLASKHGIVIKGTNYFDDLVKMKKLVTDKTGTLTHGSFEVQKIVPAKGVEQEELLNTLFAGEVLSNHPIAKAICHGQNLKKLAADVEDFQEITGFGNSATYEGKHILVGNNKLMINNQIEYEKVTDYGTVIHVSSDNKYLGYVVLADTIKKDAKPMVDYLHKLGVEVILLTGDNEANASQICKELEIDRWHSGLLPAQKTEILETELDPKKRYTTAFVGDGINDAPSIIRSDIGFAMGGIGSDAAVNNADIVLMNDDPVKIYDTMKVAKMARNTAIFNIIFSLFVKISVLILAMLPMVDLPMYVAVLADTGLTVLMVINALMLLYRKIKYPKIKK